MPADRAHWLCTILRSVCACMYVCVRVCVCVRVYVCVSMCMYISVAVLYVSMCMLFAV